MVPDSDSVSESWQADIFCSLRAQIGVVPQAPILFDDTVMNNVRYAKLTATDEEVYEACKAASIHDQILTFTDGTSPFSTYFAL
jgi:ABC-type multidrug transport system fused ATPase/permease subunit